MKETLPRRPFELFLFSCDPALIRSTVDAGVAGIVVDWERRGKRERQAGADTQIGVDTLEDLQRARAATQARVLCRIDGFGPRTAADVDSAIAAGADEILLPMVKCREEVEAVLELVRGRAGVGILVETNAAVASAAELGRLPLSRIYVGLNDLSIERRSRNLFEAIRDGTVELVRQVSRAPFGFAGLTVPDAGYPIPCHLLLGEMARIDSDFSFLRRSFHAAIRGGDPGRAVERILEAVEEARKRPPAEARSDTLRLRDAIAAWTPGRVSA